MIRLPKSTLSIGAGALVLGALIAAAPRAAHAVVATLVQVSNTVANPAITQSTNLQAAQLVELITDPIIAPFTVAVTNMTLESSAGFQTLGYSVPAGQNLVITSADVTPSNNAGSTCAFDDSVTLTNGNGNYNIRASWIVAAHQGAAHFTYPSGIVFPSGNFPSIYSNNGCYTFVTIQGYYTAN